MNPVEDKDNGNKKGTTTSPLHPQQGHIGQSGGRSDAKSSFQLPHLNDTFATLAGSLVIAGAILGSAMILGCYIRKAASVKTVVGDVIRDLTHEAKKQIYETITPKS